MKYAIHTPQNLEETIDHLIKNIGIDVDIELTRQRGSYIIFSDKIDDDKVDEVNAYYAETFGDGISEPPQVFLANNEGGTSHTLGEINKIHQEMGVPTLL